MSPVGTPHPPQFSPSVAQTLNYLLQTTRLKFDIFQLIHDMQIPHSWCWNPSPRALWLCWAIWSCRSKKQGAGDRPSPGFVKSFSLDLVFTDSILTFQRFPWFLRFWSFKVLPWSSISVWRLGGTNHSQLHPWFPPFRTSPSPNFIMIKDCDPPAPTIDCFEEESLQGGGLQLRGLERLNLGKRGIN